MHNFKNHFEGLYNDRNAGVAKRKPISLVSMGIIQSECKQLNDDMRWLVAILSDTGMRLSEGAGLLRSDIKLNADVFHVVTQCNP